jgi:hypothetical protein
MHDTIFVRIEPYITIPKMQRPTGAPYPTTPSDTLHRKHPYTDYMRAKYKPGKFVDLNTADTAELMRIPGIGPVYSAGIMAEIGDITVDEIIAEAYGEGMTVAKAVAQAKEMLQAPIQEMMDIDQEAIDVLKAIKINEYNSKFSTEYDEEANLTAISMGMNANVKIDYAAEGVDLTVSSGVTYKISEFSKSASEIKLPTGITWQEM